MNCAMFASLLCRFMDYKILRPSLNLRMSIGHTDFKMIKFRKHKHQLAVIA